MLKQFKVIETIRIVKKEQKLIKIFASIICLIDVEKNLIIMII